MTASHGHLPPRHCSWMSQDSQTVIVLCWQVPREAQPQTPPGSKRLQPFGSSWILSIPLAMGAALFLLGSSGNGIYSHQGGWDPDHCALHCLSSQLIKLHWLMSDLSLSRLPLWVVSLQGTTARSPKTSWVTIIHCFSVFQLAQPQTVGPLSR
jgi:hypothetical protein